METENTQPIVEVAATPAIPVVEPVATTEVSNGTPAPAPQYLTKEEAANLIAEAVKQAKDTGRREMQSEKDREVAAAIREKRRLEAELSMVNSSFNGLDPEVREKLELQQYRLKERNSKQWEQEEANRKALEETMTQFDNNLTEYAKEVGIDPANSNLDRGLPSEPLITRQNKFLKSVAKIQKESAKTQEDKITAKLNAEIAKARKELGLESVDKTPSSGVASDTIPTKMSEFRDWVNGLSLAEYEKQLPKIKEMQAQGKIK
jgi:hypothetical protein